MRTRSFDLQRSRRKFIEVFNEERFFILSTFYAGLIEEGQRTIQDFEKLTMFGMRNEVRLRTHIMKAQNDRTIKQYKDEQERKERELLEKLKRSMQ